MFTYLYAYMLVPKCKELWEKVNCKNYICISLSYHSYLLKLEFEFLVVFIAWIDIVKCKCEIPDRQTSVHIQTAV